MGLDITLDGYDDKYCFVDRSWKLHFKHNFAAQPHLTNGVPTSGAATQTQTLGATCRVVSLSSSSNA